MSLQQVTTAHPKVGEVVERITETVSQLVEVAIDCEDNRSAVPDSVNTAVKVFGNNFKGVQGSAENLVKAAKDIAPTYQAYPVFRRYF